MIRNKRKIKSLETLRNEVSTEFVRKRQSLLEKYLKPGTDDMFDMTKLDEYKGQITILLAEYEKKLNALDEIQCNRGNRKNDKIL